MIFNLDLPTIGTNGSVIECRSSNASYINDFGELVARPTISTGAVTVTVTCTIDPSGEKISKSYSVIVPSAISKPVTAENGHSLFLSPDERLWGGWGVAVRADSSVLTGQT